MLTAHHTVAFLVLGATLVSAVWGWIAYFRRGTAGKTLAHLLTLCQTLLVAQVGLGLLLLSSNHRAPEQLHYAYGTFALLAVLSPGSTRRRSPKRLAWFSGATLVAAALAVRAYTTA